MTELYSFSAWSTRSTMDWFGFTVKIRVSIAASLMPDSYKQKTIRFAYGRLLLIWIVYFYWNRALVDWSWKLGVNNPVKLGKCGWVVVESLLFWYEQRLPEYGMIHIIFLTLQQILNLPSLYQQILQIFHVGYCIEAVSTRSACNFKIISYCQESLDGIYLLNVKWIEYLTFKRCFLNIQLLLCTPWLISREFLSNY